LANLRTRRLDYTPTITVVYRITPPGGLWEASDRGVYTVTIDGGLPEELPLPLGGFCSFSPDDKKLAFNRVFREFRTWKRYRGGMADDVWVYDFTTKKTTNLTRHEAQDIIPMWAGDKVYWISDRDEPERFNLYSYDLKTKDVKKLTDFKEFDIKFPSLGDRAIVFENGGWIYKFDLATEGQRPAGSAFKPYVYLAALEAGYTPSDTVFDGPITIIVDPRQPPLVWEAWIGDRWDFCELEHDGTGGLNRPGDVVRLEYFQMAGGRKPAGWDQYICHGGTETWDAGPITMLKTPGGKPASLRSYIKK